MISKEYPKKIYLQNEDGAHPDCDTYYGEGMTWCEDKLNKDDVEYIRADLINEKIIHIVKRAMRDSGMINENFEAIGFEPAIISRIRKLIIQEGI